MSLFYCPNCKKIEIGNISYVEKDTIAINPRDGYGRMFRYVICKECDYPLSAIVPAINTKDKEEVEYYKSVITAYQNGEYATKEEMLNWIKKRHKQGYDAFCACNKFLETK